MGVFVNTPVVAVSIGVTGTSRQDRGNHRNSRRRNDVQFGWVVVLMVAAVGVLIRAVVAELLAGTATGRPTTRT